MYTSQYELDRIQLEERRHELELANGKFNAAKELYSIGAISKEMYEKYLDSYINFIDRELSRVN